MATRYQVGDRVIVSTTFTNEAGTPTDPSTVVAECRSPAGTLTPITPTSTVVGTWRTILPTFTEGGLWDWYVAGTAGLIAADQGTIVVDRKVTAT